MTKNEVNNHRKLFSFIALVYFPFLVDFLLKDSEESYSLNEEDIEFINSYKKAGYIVIILTLVIFISFFSPYIFNFSILNSFIVYLSYLAGLALIAYLFINIWLIFVKETPAFVFKKGDISRIKASKVKAANIDYILLYIPFLNIYLYYTKKYTKQQEYWLKESVLIYFILSLVGILSLFFPSLLNLFYLILLLIIFRSASLFFGIDIVPDFIKEKLYNSFSFYPVEIFKYFCAGLHFIFNNLILFIKGKKNKEYNYFLYHFNKEFEVLKLDSVLKNNKKYLFLLVSYVELIILLLFIGYIAYKQFNPYVYLFSLILFLFYFSFLYFRKEIIFIPILTPISRFIFKKVI